MMKIFLASILGALLFSTPIYAASDTKPTSTCQERIRQLNHTYKINF